LLENKAEIFTSHWKNRGYPHPQSVSILVLSTLILLLQSTVIKNVRDGKKSWVGGQM
jgi:hypothetical protein